MPPNRIAADKPFRDARADGKGFHPGRPSDIDMEPAEYVEVLDWIYDLPKHLLDRSEVFVPTPEQRLERIAVTRELG